MNARDERSASLWMNVEVAADAASLSGDERADVAVIAAGIAGLSVAMNLPAKAAMWWRGPGHHRGRNERGLGCHVHWMNFERCWDCPCHGSHFAIDGTVLNGPAIAPLGPAD